MALIYFLYALLGGNGLAGSTIVTRASANGADVLYSKAHVLAGLADFACIDSASGSCHYVLFPPACAMPWAALSGCPTDPLQQFALPAGATKNIAGLPPGFTVCVSADVQPVTPECKPTRPVAGLAPAGGAAASTHRQ
ncbi:hypothetical protein ACPPVV_16490 [Rhodanobacter sp. Col0626]|uniref:hypothetical protein n=1 Tax=Rhodanobacter sp. Col0626 TaxID=3415679 RepID=UPI003CEA2787